MALLAAAAALAFLSASLAPPLGYPACNDTLPSCPPWKPSCAPGHENKSACMHPQFPASDLRLMAVITQAIYRCLCDARAFFGELACDFWGTGDCCCGSDLL